MSMDELIHRRLDIILGGTKEQHLTKAKLIEHLKGDGIPNPSVTKKQLQDQCQVRGISTAVTVDKVLEGWAGKQKGAIQILYEGGW